MKCFVVLCVVALVGVNGLNLRVDPLVLTSQGLIRGERSANGAYSAFLGIPYAQVDLENPFGASLSAPDFGDDVFNANDGSMACPQLRDAGSIDCLRLNVYVPTQASSRNPMPVLVWIHGGGFTEGKASDDVAPNLVGQDIILVTINYRLGPYGFMCLDIPNVPGNQGLKDQLSALRWVRQNIGAFGGNPYNVTIGGQSAGGVSVGLHLYSPYERLYQKAILQSGVPQLLDAVVNGDEEVPFKLSTYLGFNTTDIGQAMQFLATTSPNLIIGATKELKIEFRPCRERSFSGVENFMTDDPFTMSNPTKIRNIPILIGVTSNEKLPSGARHNTNTVNDVLVRYFNLNEDDLATASTIINHYYIGDGVSADDEQKLENFFSDIYFYYPLEMAVAKFFEEGSGPIYDYVFNYSGEHGELAHSSEMNYLFAVSYESFNDEEKTVSDRLTSLWSNFIKYGNPTPAIDDLTPVIWEPIGDNVRPYLKIDTEATIGHRFRKENVAFWELFYLIYGQYNKLMRACSL